MTNMHATCEPYFCDLSQLTRILPTQAKSRCTHAFLADRAHGCASQVGVVATCNMVAVLLLALALAFQRSPKLGIRITRATKRTRWWRSNECQLANFNACA